MRRQCVRQPHEAEQRGREIRLYMVAEADRWGMCGGEGKSHSASGPLLGVNGSLPSCIYRAGERQGRTAGRFGSKAYTRGEGEGGGGETTGG